MFAMTSRYYGIGVGEYRRTDGSTITYVRRRWLPRPDELAEIGEHVVRAGERLDHIAGAELGDPELFWQLADANRAMRPDDLTAEPGRRLRVTLPEGMTGGGLSDAVIGGGGGA